MKAPSWTYRSAPVVPLTENQTSLCVGHSHGALPPEDLDNLYSVALAHQTDYSLNTPYFPQPIFESVSGAYGRPLRLSTRALMCVCRVAAITHEATHTHTTYLKMVHTRGFVHGPPETG